MGMIRLAVDAMGGDYAPGEIIAGALQGAQDLGLGLILVGDRNAVNGELSKHPADGLDIEVVHAGDVIQMAEDPSQAVRSKPEASINVACRVVLEGRADGVLTMGHTGAGMVAALFNFGRISGVERPAAIVPLLGLRQDLFLIDAGANADVRPNHLLQFALMGSAYVKNVSNIPSPRVGLLSNGSEANKGNKTGKEAYTLLAASKWLNFAGNIEGHDILGGDIHLVVADGFVGNILLKSMEGLTANLLSQAQGVAAELPGGPAATVQTYLERLQAQYHYSRYGASTLLGVQHPIFIGHGRSKAAAVRSGMATAQRMIAANVIDSLITVFEG